MAYQKQNNLNPNQLTHPTRQRFFEIELSQGLKKLMPFFNNDIHQTMQILINKLTTPTYRNTMQEAFYLFYFQNPKHNELVQYFRYKNLGVHKIRSFTGASPNSLVRGGTYDTIPNFDPLFPFWDELPHAVFVWNTLKKNLNLFDEDLVHTTEPKQTKQTQNPQTPPRQIIEPKPTPQETVSPSSVPTPKKPKQQEKPKEKELTAMEKALKELNDYADYYQRQLLLPWHERDENKTIGKTMNEELLEAEGYEDPMLAFEEE